MRLFLFLFSLIPLTLLAQQDIDIQEIMKGYDFIGHPPENIQWSANGNEVYFNRRSNNEKHQLTYNVRSNSIDTINSDEKFLLPDDIFDASSRKAYFEVSENTLYKVIPSKNEREAVYTRKEGIFNVQHVIDSDKIYFQIKNDLFSIDTEKNYFKQVTITQSEKKDATSNNFLDNQHKALFIDRSKSNGSSQSKNTFAELKTDELSIRSIQVSPNEKHLIYRLSSNSQPRYTNVMNFLSEDGYASPVKARPKVGTIEAPNMKLAVYSFEKDSSYILSFNDLEGIRTAPDYYKEYGRPETLEADKALIIHEVDFSPNGKQALISIKSFDNKDRWLLSYDLSNNKMITVDHQHDEAWIGGPGISGWNYYKGNIGWIDDSHIYFQSEESGYSHLYSFNFATGSKEALTNGEWEIHDTKLSNDRSSFYITANKNHPGNRSFYKLDIASKSLTPILTKDGSYEVNISPDEKWLAIRYSYKNKPWELYIAKNKSNPELKQITKSTTQAFTSIAWQDPEVVKIPTENGLHSYARLYEPKSDVKNGAAIIFVHGAGYLQNAHNYWSGYYREYMFHNLLVEKGYTVLDIDYRASKGYGRDHRTAIYRHMGEADLNDQLIGKKWLTEKKGIDPEKVGIYGGSYGGFITLMALLKHPGEFQCGGALRSVTDWAHYNHPYTSNILNTPDLDSLAYKRSSPIYFAEGLSDRLIMFHGMMDDNVQYQDIIRLSQRFIELGKENWDLASYPIEGHGFKTPTSWTDEYRRLYKMFNRYLLK
tara:strand:- start:28065 stop:30359 length:2295 start_codon:yes stop_codon:yes gene_type:complete